MKKWMMIFSILAFLAGCNTPGAEEPEAEQPKEKKAFSRVEYDNQKQEILALKDSVYRTDDLDRLRNYNELLLKKTIAFADDYPRDMQSAEFLFLGARAANGLGQYRKSIAMMDRIINEYKQYENMPEVYFLKAFTYDEALKEKPKAKSLYLKLIRTFPNDPLAEQAQLLLDNLYLSDKELIEKYN